METATSQGSSSLAEVLFGKSSSRPDEVWQEVRFDSPISYLECRRGEEVLEALVRAAGAVLRLEGVCRCCCCCVWRECAGVVAGVDLDAELCCCACWLANCLTCTHAVGANSTNASMQLEHTHIMRPG